MVSGRRRRKQKFFKISLDGRYDKKDWQALDQSCYLCLETGSCLGSAGR